VLWSLKKQSTDDLSAVKNTCFIPPSPIMFGRYSTVLPSSNIAFVVFTIQPLYNNTSVLSSEEPFFS